MSNLNKKHSKEIFEEMCKRVDLDYSSIDFFKKDWYDENQWTVDEGIRFTNWLKQYLQENPEAITELNEIGLNKDTPEEMARYFTAFFGWDYYNE